MSRKISDTELAEHGDPDSLWLAVHGQIYDLTDFASEHPGGKHILYQYAGRDATAAYDEVHSPSLIINSLAAKDHVGFLDAPANPAARDPRSTTVSTRPSRPPLASIINLQDFEAAAEKTLSARAWAFIHGGSNDNVTRDANQSLMRRIWLRPAVLSPALAAAGGVVNMRTTLFGLPLALPVYVAPMGAARNGGPGGDIALTRGAAAAGTALCISTASSFPLDEVLAATPHPGCFFQLYVSKDRRKTAEMLRLAESSGKVKAVFVTVDLPAGTKREASERIRLLEEAVVPTGHGTRSSATGKGHQLGAGYASRADALIDPLLCWEDLKWVRSVTKLPLLLKGIQRSKDARRAMETGCDGIVVSNHGGRAADGAPPSILTLLELHKNCPEVFGAMEVLIDGGFRRGSDIVKAICLGASAVGIGRPFLYAIGYGEDGMEHAVEIVRDEIETAMRLCGLGDLMREACPDFVNTNEINHLVPSEAHPFARKAIRRDLKL